VEQRVGVARIIGNMALVNSGVHTGNNFSKIIGHLGARPKKIFARPVPGRKILKNIGFKGCQVINLHGAPNY
jgi:hypothetical protein